MFISMREHFVVCIFQETILVLYVKLIKLFLTQDKLDGFVELLFVDAKRNYYPKLTFSAVVCRNLIDYDGISAKQLQNKHRDTRSGTVTSKQ